MATRQALNLLINELLEDVQDEHLQERFKLSLQQVQKLTNSQQGITSKLCLDGQISLVTGGGRGIGRALAHGLGEAGCKVAVVDIIFARAQEVAEELKIKGIDSIALPVDVSKKAEVQSMVQTIIDTWGDLHIACNNAGIVMNSASEDTDESEWNQTMEINLDGVFFCCQAEAKHMLAKGYGKIINTASICAHVYVRPQTQVAYNTAKAGVVHMTKTLGAEWASQGVCVNSISPGYMDTPLIGSKECDPYKEKWIENDIPMKRLGQVEELVGAVILLASPLSNFTTGTDLVIDGGLTCW